MNRLETINKTVDNFQKVLDKFPEFRYAGDPILRQKTQPVSFAEGVKIGRSLGEVLVSYRKLVGYGRGLAAPQIGLDKSVFVTFLDDEVQIYLNPVIKYSSNEINYYRELCLSSGIFWGDIPRPAHITMEWTDIKGNLISKDFDSFLARLLQHEYYHLKGELNLDIVLPGSLEIVIDDPLKESLREHPLKS